MEKVQTLPVEIQSKILSYLRVAILVDDVLSTGDNDLIVEYISVNKLWNEGTLKLVILHDNCLLYTSPSPRDRQKSRMPSSA